MNNSRVWFCAVMAACGGAGCATSSTYRIPAAEMQRLAELDDAQRGEVVRVIPADASTKAYAAIPLPPAAPPPAVAAPPPMVSPGPPLADATSPFPDAASAPAPDDDDGVESDGPNVEIQGGGQVNVSARPGPPTVFVAPSPPRHLVGPTVRGAPGPAIGRPAGGHISPGHIGGGHLGGGHIGGGGHGGSLHLGGGSGSGALIALVAAVVVVGAVVAIADAESSPPSYDGWARIHPEHPLHLFYRSGVKRVIKLRDLRPADLAGLADTILKDSDGRVHRLPEPAPSPI